eukprot:m.74171 g.74171  ORF g.74171 m.74171 type:complete len:464 (-) comp12451_c0_seq1:46-1437(-)
MADERKEVTEGDKGDASGDLDEMYNDPPPHRLVGSSASISVEENTKSNFRHRASKTSIILATHNELRSESMTDEPTFVQTDGDEKKAYEFQNETNVDDVFETQAERIELDKGETTETEQEDDGLPWYDESWMDLHIMLFLFLSGHKRKKISNKKSHVIFGYLCKWPIQRLMIHLFHFAVIIVQVGVPAYLLWAMQIMRVRVYEFNPFFASSFGVWLSWFTFLSLPLSFVGMEILSQMRKSGELLLWMWYTEDNKNKTARAQTLFIAFVLLAFNWASSIIIYVLTYFILTLRVDPDAQRPNGDFLPPIIDILKDSVAIVYLVKVDEIAYAFLEASNLLPKFVTPGKLNRSNKAMAEVQRKFINSTVYKVYYIGYWLTVAFVIIMSFFASIMVWKSKCFFQPCVDWMVKHNKQFAFISCRMISADTPLPSCAPSSYWLDEITWDREMLPCADNFTAFHHDCIDAF